MFVYEPPPGRTGVRAEVVLTDETAVWAPRETLVPLTVVFKRPFALESIAVECRYPIVVEFDSIPALRFEPPASEMAIAKPAPKDLEMCQTLNFRVIGNPIEISQIRFCGPPSPLEPTDQGLRMIDGRNKTGLRQVTPRSDPRSFQHEILFPRGVTMCGISYVGVHALAEVLVMYETDQRIGPDALRFVIPSDIDQFVLAFPYYCQDCTRMVLMYVPQNRTGWRLPTVQAVIVRTAEDPSFRRSISHNAMTSRT
jgi:hypothetical protein